MSFFFSDITGAHLLSGFVTIPELPTKVRAFSIAVFTASLFHSLDSLVDVRMSRE